MFDPYAKWLGITKRAGLPNHFELLGLSPDVDDADVIANAADMRMVHVRTFQAGPYSQQSQQVLNELAQARLCLLDPQRRAAYRASLSPEAVLHAPLAPPAKLPEQQAPEIVRSGEYPLSAAPAPGSQHEVLGSMPAREANDLNPVGSQQPGIVETRSTAAKKNVRSKRPGPPPSNRIGPPVEMSGAANSADHAEPTLYEPRREPGVAERSHDRSVRLTARNSNLFYLGLSLGIIALGGAAVAILVWIAQRQEPALARNVTQQQSEEVRQSAPATTQPPGTEAATAGTSTTQAEVPPPTKPPVALQSPPAPIPDQSKKSAPPEKNPAAKKASAPVAPLVRFKRGEPVDLLASAGLPGDIIRVAGPPPCDFEVTASGLKKLPAPGFLDTSLLPLSLGTETTRDAWKQEDYRLTAKVTPQAQGAVFFSFPVSKRQFVAFFGGAGRNVGFAVEPIEVSNAVRRDVGPVKSGHAYTVEITVEALGDSHDARISVELDGQSVISWRGSTQDISPDSSVTPLPKQDECVVFGFGAQQEIGVELHEFKVQKLPQTSQSQLRRARSLWADF